MARLVLAVLALLYAVATARMAYQLTNGAESLLRSGSYVESFSCEGLPYGYYADTDNDCEIFHVCLPVTDGGGALVETAHFSFVCPNNTVFSQDNLVCAGEEEALPCSESRTLYELSNAEFGVIPEERV